MRYIITIALVFMLSGCHFSAVCFARTYPKRPQRNEVKAIMQKVADWQIEHFSYAADGTPGYLHDYGIDAWTNATLYIGMVEWMKISNDETYANWLYQIGEKNKWMIPSNFSSFPKYTLYHADELCVGQFYLAMYEKYKEEKMIQPTKERIDFILENPPATDMSNKNKQLWTWSDALFMAPPVYLHLGMLTQEQAYIGFMNALFTQTYNHLYDKEETLFFRDDSYFNKKEANGQKVFWGRGNGWVVAGLVNILKIMPQESPERAFYEKLLVELLTRLVQLQDKQGFWHASLLDSKSYPSPETSATALITYALAYGLNNNLLNYNRFYPATCKAWKSLTSAVADTGKLGWVQPIGADPKKVTADMTAVYGVGAFLLAGSEIYKLASK